MRLSTSTRICESVLWDKKTLFYDCPTAIGKIARAGYRVIDLALMSYTKPGREMTRDNWRDWVARVREAVNECELVVSQAHAHAFNPAPAHTALELQWHEELICRCIEAAGMLSVPWLVIHPVYIMDDVWYSWKKSMQDNLERFRRYEALAARHKVGIAVENIHGANRVHRFGAGPEDLLELLYRLDSQCFGVCWDTGHANLCGIDQRRALEMLAGSLKATHIADNDGQTDLHIAPFFGKIDWKTVLRTLKDIGYAGDFTYEIPNFANGFDDGFHDEALLFSRKLGEYLLRLGS